MPALIDPSNEIWKPIVGYEGSYEISNQGRIVSLRKSGRHIKKLPVGKNGYVTTVLYKSGKPYYYLVHTLVLTTFIGPRPIGMECRHFPNATRTDNRLTNLSWATRKDNHFDKWAHGTRQIGEKGNGAKLTEIKVLEIRQLLKEGYSQVKISELYGVTHRVIGRILHRQSWSHVG